MDKQQIISLIESQIKLGNVSKSDILSLFRDKDGELYKDAPSKNITHTFYGIGAIIAIVGVVILVGQNWQEIGFLGRILSTMGVCLVTYISALLFGKPEQNLISSSMFVISTALLPLSSYVLLEEAGIKFDWKSQLVTALVALLLFLVAWKISKKNILALISLGFSSWAYYALIMKVVEYSSNNSDILKWATMLIGISYIILAYSYKKIWPANDDLDEIEKDRIQGIVYGLGTLGVLGAGISIGGVFDLIFIAMIFGAFYGSVYLRSRMMLILGALFLMGHIVKLTSKYFVNSIGWPVALIIVGFLIIGIGYMTFYLNRRFISGK